MNPLISTGVEIFVGAVDIDASLLSPIYFAWITSCRKIAGQQVKLSGAYRPAVYHYSMGAHNYREILNEIMEDQDKLLVVPTLQTQECFNC